MHRQANQTMQMTQNAHTPAKYWWASQHANVSQLPPLCRELSLPCLAALRRSRQHVLFVKFDLCWSILGQFWLKKPGSDVMKTPIIGVVWPNFGGSHRKVVLSVWRACVCVCGIAGACVLCLFCCFVCCGSFGVCDSVNHWRVIICNCREGGAQNAIFEFWGLSVCLLSAQQHMPALSHSRAHRMPSPTPLR